MIEKQTTALTEILRKKNIRQYAGDAFLKIIKAVYLGNAEVLPDDIDDMKNLIFHIPTVLFWDKMQRYLFGTFKDYGEQVKMANKFTHDNSAYEKFVKSQIHLINEMNDDKKIDYFATLTRCFLLNDMEEALFYKLANFINICTPEELKFIKDFGYNQKSENKLEISSLYQYGLFEQQVPESGGAEYVLSGFAKALKQDSLNYEEGLNGEKRLLSYNQITPLNIPEPASNEEVNSMIKQIFND